MKRKQKDAFIEEYSKLVGKKVVGVAVGVGSDPQCALRFDDGTIAWILCDPEGNGPGFLEIQK